MVQRHTLKLKIVDQGLLLSSGDGNGLVHCSVSSRRGGRIDVVVARCRVRRAGRIRESHSRSHFEFSMILKKSYCDWSLCCDSDCVKSLFERVGVVELVSRVWLEVWLNVNKRVTREVMRSPAEPHYSRGKRLNRPAVGASIFRPAAGACRCLIIHLPAQSCTLVFRRNILQ